MPIIFAVGLLCYDRFEETPNKKVVNMSKLSKPYFRASTKNMNGSLNLNMRQRLGGFPNGI